MHADLARAARENVGVYEGGPIDSRKEVLLEPVGEMEGRLLRDVLHSAQ